MLKQIKVSQLDIKCNHCKNDYSFKVDKTKKSKFNQEFNQFDNYPAECPHCQSLEFFNLNIPEYDDDEPQIEQDPDIPQSEKDQRKWVRRLMRLVRDDFNDALFDENGEARSDKRKLLRSESLGKKNQ